MSKHINADKLNIEVCQMDCRKCGNRRLKKHGQCSPESFCFMTCIKITKKPDICTDNDAEIIELENWAELQIKR